MATSTSKSTLVSRATKLIAGTKKHYPNGSETLLVGGATFTAAALTQLIQDFVDERGVVEASKAATTARIQAERAQAPARIAVIRAYETFVRGTFGVSADVLADFGLAPPKARAPQSAEKKAAAAAKRAATRGLRNTLGKKAKKAIKSDVTASLVVTPSTAAQAKAPVPAAAPAAPATATAAAPAPRVP
jgi:hypothetical protein